MDLRCTASTDIAGSAEQLYDMISDVTRMGEWSPTCSSCRWDDGDGPREGAWFTGQNVISDDAEEAMRGLDPATLAQIGIVQTPEGPRGETRSVVVVADRGTEFAFITGGSHVRWDYTFASTADGCRVTESWELLPDGVALFEQQFGDGAEAAISERAETARTGIEKTLAALKRAAEA